MPHEMALFSAIGSRIFSPVQSFGPVILTGAKDQPGAGVFAASRKTELVDGRRACRSLIIGRQ